MTSKGRTWAARSVACPTCRAAPGDPCRAVGHGGKLGDIYRDSRWNDPASHLARTMLARGLMLMPEAKARMEGL